MQATRARMLGVVVVILAACTTGPTIRTHVDPTTDLSRFRSFGFYSEQSASYASFLSRYIESAVADEMVARGYVRSDTPDLLINFHVQTQDKVQVTQTPTAYYGWRRGYGWAGGGYQTDVRQYKEGTLNIDLVDRSRNQLVWEGVAVGRVQTKSMDDPQPAIKAVVAQVFAEYPARPTGT
jgi:hypothetical protein